jgi:hypothetical protein
MNNQFGRIKYPEEGLINVLIAKCTIEAIRDNASIFLCLLALVGKMILTGK